MIWWSLRSAVTTLSFLWMTVCGFRLKARECLCWLTSTVSQDGNGNVWCSPYVFILSLLRASFMVMQEWTGVGIFFQIKNIQKAYT